MGLGDDDPEAKKHHVTSTTLFDMASVTKLFVVTTFLDARGSGRGPSGRCRADPTRVGRHLRPIQPYEDPLGGPGWVTVANGSAVDAGGRSGICSRIPAGSCLRGVRSSVGQRRG